MSLRGPMAGLSSSSPSHVGPNPQRKQYRPRPPGPVGVELFNAGHQSLEAPPLGVPADCLGVAASLRLHRKRETHQDATLWITGQRQHTAGG